MPRLSFSLTKIARERYIGEINGSMVHSSCQLIMPMSIKPFGRPISYTVKGALKGKTNVATLFLMIAPSESFSQAYTPNI